MWGNSDATEEVVDELRAERAGAIDAATHVKLSGNRNPDLSWSGLPAGTKSLAITCHDPVVPSKGDDVNKEGRTIPASLPRVDFFHWVLVDLPAEVFHLADAWTPGRRGIRPETLADRDVRGAAVLLHTGWDRWFGRPEYGQGAPFLTGAAAQWLIDAGAVLVGIDSVNIDDTESGGERPSHSLLLGAGVHVVEHLTNLGALPSRGARFTAAPPAVEGFGTFPVRAFAEVPA